MENLLSVHWGTPPGIRPRAVSGAMLTMPLLKEFLFRPPSRALRPERWGWDHEHAPLLVLESPAVL